MANYNESETMRGTTLEKEFDSSFSGDEKASMILGLSAEKFVRESKKIKVKDIGLTEPVKRGRKKTIVGLTKSIKELGVINPVHVMLTENGESEDTDSYKYIVLDGVRRIFGARKNGIEEIDAIVWDFKDKEQGYDSSLMLSLILNRYQSRSWEEIWELYQILELQTNVTPNTVEYLFQLESGDAMKLKDIMLCEYDDPKVALRNNEKPLEACYKMLQKLRKEENKLEKDDNTGFADTVDAVNEIVTQDNEEEPKPTLSNEDVLELMEMAEDIQSSDSVEVDENDFDSMSKPDESFVEQQKVGERHPIDPELRSSVIQRDESKCSCCGLKMIGSRLGVLAVHHIIPVHSGGKDVLENLTTLCLNCHINVHVMERNGGSIMMDKKDFDRLEESERKSLVKALKLSRIAVESDKRKGLTKKDIREKTKESVKHIMPTQGLEENQKAYAMAEERAKKEE